MKLYNPNFKKTFLFERKTYKEKEKELEVDSGKYYLRKEIETAREKLKEANVFVITYGQHISRLNEVEVMKAKYSLLYQGDKKLPMHFFLILFECVYDQTRDLNIFQSFISKDALESFLNKIQIDGNTSDFLYKTDFVKQTKCKIMYKLDNNFSGEIIEGLFDTERMFYVRVKEEYVDVVENFLNSPDCYKLWNIFSHHVLVTECSNFVSKEVKNYYDNIRFGLTVFDRENDPEYSENIYKVLEFKDYFIENINRDFLIEDLRPFYGNVTSTSIFNNFVRTKIPNPTDFYAEALNHIKLDPCDKEKTACVIRQIENSLKVMNITASSKLRFGQITFSFLTFRVIQMISTLTEEFREKFPNDVSSVKTSYSISDPTEDGTTGVICEIKVFSPDNSNHYCEATIEEKDKFDPKSLSFKISDSIGFRNKFRVMDGNVKAKCVHVFHGTMNEIDDFTLFSLWQQSTIVEGRNYSFNMYGLYKTKRDKGVNLKPFKERMLEVLGKDKKFLVTIWEREQIRHLTDKEIEKHGQDGCEDIVDNSKFEEENQVLEDETHIRNDNDTMEDDETITTEVNKNILYLIEEKPQIETSEALFLQASYTKFAYNPFDVKKIWYGNTWVERKFLDDKQFDKKGKFFRRMKMENGFLVAVPRIVTIDLISSDSTYPYLCKIFLSLNWEYRKDFIWKKDGDFRHLFFKKGDLEVRLSQVETNEVNYMLITCGGEFVGYKSGNVMIKCKSDEKSKVVIEEKDRIGFGYSKDNGYASTGCLHQDIRGICISNIQELTNFGRAFKSKLRLTGPFKRSFLSNNKKPDYCDSKILYQDSIIQIMNRTSNPMEAKTTTYFTPKECVEVKTIEKERYVLFHLYFPLDEHEKMIEIIEKVVPKGKDLCERIRKLEKELKTLSLKKKNKTISKSIREKHETIENLKVQIESIGYKPVLDGFYIQEVNYIEIDEEGNETNQIKNFIVYDHFVKISKTVQDVYMLHHESIQSTFPLFGGKGEFILPRSNPKDGFINIDGKDRIIEVKTSPSLYRAGIQAYDAKYFDSEKLMAAYNGIATTKLLNKFLNEDFLNCGITKMEILSALNACMVHLRVTNELIKEFSREKLSFMLDVTSSIGEFAKIPYVNWNPNEKYDIRKIQVNTDNKLAVRKLIKPNLFQRKYRVAEKYKKKVEKNLYSELLQEFTFNLTSKKSLKFDINYVDEDLRESFRGLKELMRKRWKFYVEDYKHITTQDLVDDSFNFNMVVYFELYAANSETHPDMMQPEELSQRIISEFSKKNDQYIRDLMDDEFDFIEDEEEEKDLESNKEVKLNISEFEYKGEMDKSLIIHLQEFLEFDV